MLECANHPHVKTNQGRITGITPEWSKNYITTSQIVSSCAQHSKQQNLGPKNMPMLPEHVACKIVTGCQDGVHQPHTGSPRSPIIQTAVYYNFMHPPYTLPSRLMMCSSFAGKCTAFIPHCLNLSSSPHQANLFVPSESTPQHSFATGTAQQSVWWKSCNMP